MRVKRLQAASAAGHAARQSGQAVVRHLGHGRRHGWTVTKWLNADAMAMLSGVVATTGEPSLAAGRAG